MQARDVMSTRVATIKPDTTVGVIVALLLERRISGLPVLDDGEVAHPLAPAGGEPQQPSRHLRRCHVAGPSAATHWAS